MVARVFTLTCNGPDELARSGLRTLQAVLNHCRTHEGRAQILVMDGELGPPSPSQWAERLEAYRQALQAFCDQMMVAGEEEFTVTVAEVPGRLIRLDVVHKETSA